MTATKAVNVHTIPDAAHNEFAIRAESYDPLFLNTSVTAHLDLAHIKPQYSSFEELFGFANRPKPNAHFEPPPGIQSYSNRFFRSALAPTLTLSSIEKAQEKPEDTSPLSSFFNLAFRLALLQEETIGRLFASIRE